MQASFPGAKDHKRDVWLKNHPDVRRYRQQIMYLYKRELFEIYSCSLLPHFSGACCILVVGWNERSPSLPFTQYVGIIPFSHNILSNGQPVPAFLLDAVSHIPPYNKGSRGICTHNSLLPRLISKLNGLDRAMWVLIKNTQENTLFFWYFWQYWEFNQEVSIPPVLPVLEVVISLYHQSLNSQFYRYSNSWDTSVAAHLYFREYLSGHQSTFLTAEWFLIAVLFHVGC